MTVTPQRNARKNVARFIVNRWSPRSFQPKTIAPEALLDILDAGRWAPSAYNTQTWHFLHASRDTAQWNEFLSWLTPFNQSWAANASAIIYIASKTEALSPQSGKAHPVPSHAFDAGAAALLLQLQANHLGLASHPVSGIDQDMARKGLNLPDDMVLHAAIVIGHQDSREHLSASLKDKEAPSGRFDLNEIATQGKWPSN